MWDLGIVLGVASQKMQQLPSNFFRLQDVELLSNQLLELSGGFRGPKSDERLLLIRAINEKRLTSHARGHSGLECFFPLGRWVVKVYPSESRISPSTQHRIFLSKRLRELLSLSLSLSLSQGGHFTATYWREMCTSLQSTS